MLTHEQEDTLYHLLVGILPEEQAEGVIQTIDTMDKNGAKRLYKMKYLASLLHTTIDNIPERPDYVEQEHLTFLDDLRESGETNMMGATPYLQEEFEMGKSQAREVLTYWMRTFGNPHR